jgi:hypothetical protein
MSVSRGDGEPEIDLSWFDGSVVTDISSDGRTVLFTEGHEAENPHYASYLRELDGSPAVRLGDGVSTRLSADGQWALAILVPRSELFAYPVGFGDPRKIHIDGLDRPTWAGFHPDGRRLLVVGAAAGGEYRLFLVPLEGGAPSLVCDEPIASSRIAGPTLSPDGAQAAVRYQSGRHALVDIAQRTVTPLESLGVEDSVLGFDAAGGHLFVSSGDAAGTHVVRMSIATGERTPWRTLAPPDRTGVFYLGSPALSRDGSAMAYSYYRHITDLYLVEGLA